VTVLVEGNLRIEFPSTVRAWKFDDGEVHGLSHCMKAVDFVVEERDRISFIELKDPDHPRATNESREKFVNDIQSGKLDEELKYKFRDTFLYRWASGKGYRKIHYWVIIAMEDLLASDLMRRGESLRRKLPVGVDLVGWTRPIADDCIVFNYETWNRYHEHFPLSRVS